MARKQWSHSQTQIFRSCERKWFFQYALGARINSKDSLKREIALLKKIRPSWFWRGDLVHGTIKATLDRIRYGNPPLPLKSALALLTERATTQWEDSLRRTRDLDPRSQCDPEGPILIEHFYSGQFPFTSLKSILSDTSQNLTCFYEWASAQNLFQRVSQAAEKWIDPPNSPGFSLGDINFVTKIDLALKTENAFEIFDWKTGKVPDGNFNLRPEYKQVSLYALWPLVTLGVPTEQVSLNVVFLGDPRGAKAVSVEVAYERVPELLQEAELVVSAGRDVLDTREEYRLEDFDFASSAKTCVTCPFQAICRETVGLESRA